MAALMVFGVFLVSIALSIPIATSMIVGSISPILLLGKGGSIVQLLNNTFSGAHSVAPEIWTFRQTFSKSIFFFAFTLAER